MNLRSSHDILAAIAPLVVLAWPSSCLAAEGDSAAPTSMPAQQAKAAGKDPFNVPEGTINKLQKYIGGLNQIQPTSSLRPNITDLYQKRATAQLRACDKILAAKPRPEQAQAAIQVKMAALASCSASWAMRRCRTGSNPWRNKSRNLV